MLRNTFIIVWRNLFKHSFYSFLNIFGLALGLASGFLILQYVYYETSYDKFFENKENIYRVQLDRFDNGELSTQWAAGCAGAGIAMKEDFPEVLDFVNLHSSGALLSYGRDYFQPESGYYAGAQFFKIFSVPLIRGVDSLVLKDPFTVALSESMASRIFGREDPVGKVLKMNDDIDFTVTGVFADFPERSHMDFDVLYSFETYVSFNGEEARTAWQWDGFLNYVLLRPGTDPKALEAKFPAFTERRAKDIFEEYNAGMEFHLQPLDRIHLISDYRGEIKPTGDERATYFLLIIGLFVIFIAWINYVNLTTANSLKRAREVGIRKALGSSRRQLVRQFLLESSFINLLAFGLAALMVLAAFPWFSDFLGREQSYTWPDSTGFWLGIFAFFMLGIGVSGFYPAIVLSGFRPVEVLKGKFTGGSSGNFLRKGLVTFQFVASIFLITGTFVVYKQLQYMRSQDLGFDLEQTLVVETPNYASDSLMRPHDNVFRNLVSGESAVKGLSTSSTVPGRNSGFNAGGIRLLSQTAAESNQYRVVVMDEEMVDFYGFDLLAGRNFDPSYGGEELNVLFNEAAMERIGFHDPDELIDKRINFWGDTMTIVGMLKNFRQESPKQAYDALIFRYTPSSSSFYSIKLNSPDMAGSVAMVQRHFETAFDNKPFEYFFLDDFYNEQYKAETNFGAIFGLFAGLAILVACLGLFGLASYVTNLRTKEVGIRKVLGASVENLWFLLAFDFLKWVCLAILIAVPLNYFVMNNWLDNFATRIGLTWWIFLIPALVLLAIAIGTVSYHTLRSASLNPALTLKDE